jgi:hypothetical protein
MKGVKCAVIKSNHNSTMEVTMTSSIDDLVQMRDVQTLYELMAEDENWMTQLDAAEGLVKLGDKRGLEFLLSARQSEDREIGDVAREILDSPVVKRMADEIKAEERYKIQGKIDIAKKRLQKEQKVFRYKMIFLPTGELLDEDPTSEGFDVPGLSEYGLEGWEVVNMIPRRGQVFGGSVDEYISGAYFLMKKEVAADESAELDSV